MKDYKNIDRLFQEKFRDFEQNPSSQIWGNISDSLSNKPKKDRRVLWLWFSGVAAGLALLLTINNPFTTTDIPNYNTTDTDNARIKKNNSPEIEITNTTKEISPNNKNQIEINNIPQNKTNLFNTKTQKEITNNTPSKGLNITPSKTYNTSKNKQFRISNTFVTSNKLSDQKNNTINDKSTKDLPQNKIAQNNSTKKEQSNIPKFESSEKNINQLDEIIADNKVVSHEMPNSISLESLNEDTKQTSETENTSNKWIISTVTAPILFGAFDKNISSIDSQFNNNTKKGQFSVAYGVQLAYQVNNRFSIQSGLHQVDYGYKTYDVFVSPDRFASVYSNISYNDDADLIDINPIPSSESGQENQETGRKDSKGSLTQIFGYFEIPLEAKYKLKKGNFGINILGGFSTLILNKNEIFIETEEFTNIIGEASNLNSLNLTGNLGLELDYKIYQNIHFNITPMFKVHANTFKKDTGGFNPYAVGIYSGLNFRF